MHLPDRNTSPDVQPKHWSGPDAEQASQLLSQLVQPLEVLSKNSPLAHVGRHLPSLSTGLLDGHDVHWLNCEPEQVAQSPWHVPQKVELEGNVPEGHEETHWPLEASRPGVLQVRQKSAESTQVPQEESQAGNSNL
jgi:hypothetical protein